MRQVLVKANFLKVPTNFQKAITILGLITGLGLFIVTTSAPTAHAAHALKDTLITAGIGTAVGTVLGLSTLPFYSQPTDHLGNVLIGAGVGLAAGLGVALYLLATPDTPSTRDGNDHDLPESVNDSRSKRSGKIYPSARGFAGTRKDIGPSRNVSELRRETRPFHPRPNGWALAVNLVGIRF